MDSSNFNTHFYLLDYISMYLDSNSLHHNSYKILHAMENIYL
jgi:hypothetical protein